MTLITIPETRERLRVFAPIDGLEFRASNDGETYTLAGHAAVFNKMSDDLGGFREVIAPGAFSQVLFNEPDVRALFNHDPSKVLARTISKTLELREDPIGLRIWAKAPKGVSYVEDLRILMDRGDIDQMSFGFRVAPEGDEWAVAEDGTVVRTIRQVGELFDVSPVTFPAYPQTDVNMRSVLDAAIEEGRLPGSGGEGGDNRAATNDSSDAETAATPSGSDGQRAARPAVDERRRRMRRLELDRLAG